MRTHLKFIAVVCLLALTSATLTGGLAVAVGHRLGLAPGELLLLFSGTAGTAFTSVVALAELATRTRPDRRPETTPASPVPVPVPAPAPAPAPTPDNNGRTPDRHCE
ncbi:hypothetical protein ACWD4G_42495 [Streptomyces sp. NPDC002643]